MTIGNSINKIDNHQENCVVNMVNLSINWENKKIQETVGGIDVIDPHQREQLIKIFEDN